MSEYDEFEAIAISRDLMRKPEIATIALALARINAPTNVVVTKDRIPPVYVTLAYRLITHDADRQAFLALLRMITEE
jgi:hypothetical protein